MNYSKRVNHLYILHIPTCLRTSHNQEESLRKGDSREMYQLTPHDLRRMGGRVCIGTLATWPYRMESRIMYVST